MSKELKIVFILVFLLPIVGFIILATKNNSPDPVLTNIIGLEAIPSSYSLGDVPRLGGLITRQYLIKNTTNKILKLKKITTSCMCTKAKVVIDGKSTDFFSLEHPGDKNAPVNREILPGAQATVVVEFDPNAHGPQGIGYIDRSIDLIFSDPPAVLELTFNATVIEK